MDGCTSAFYNVFFQVTITLDFLGCPIVCVKPLQPCGIQIWRLLHEAWYVKGMSYTTPLPNFLDHYSKTPLFHNHLIIWVVISLNRKSYII